MNPDNLIIRELSKDDYSDFQQHFTRHLKESGENGLFFTPFDPDGKAGPRGMDPAALATALSEPGWQRWFAAFLPSGEMVGHVDLKADHLPTSLHRCWLGIGIEKPYRNRGLGIKLMAEAIEFARTSTSLEWIDLMVFTINHPARVLYNKMGFREIGTVEDRFRICGQSMDDIHMVLRLDK